MSIDMLDDDFILSMTSEMYDRVHELATWVQRHQENLTPGLLKKSVEYGSADLELIGEAMKMLLPDDRQDASPLILGITFYMLGKVARIFSQVKEGKDPTDSFLDSHIYAMMALRILQEGKWL